MTLRFAFIADPQLGCMATFSGQDEAASARFAERGMRVRPFPSTSSFAWDTERWVTTVETLAATEVDFVVVGGDMIERTDSAAQLETYKAIANDLGTIPLHHVPGNHDICPDQVIPTEESIEWFRRHFGPDHFAFTHECGPGSVATFILLNSPAIQQPRHVPGVDDLELSFLEEELQAAMTRNGPIAVFTHHPPFLVDPDEVDNYWNLPLKARHRMLDLCVEHGVEVVFTGHRHLNDHATYKGVQIITSAAAGFPLGYDPPGYRIVEVHPGGFEHSYHGISNPGWDKIGGDPRDDPEPTQP